MLPELKKAYLDGRMMLLLGAGTSYNSLDGNGQSLPLGEKLAAEIAQIPGYTFHGERLSEVYSAVQNVDEDGLRKFLARRLLHTRPGGDLLGLAQYRWSRIYTLNIDDTLENAVRKVGKQKLSVFGRLDRLVESDPVFGELQLIKLNGSADRLDDGLIFAPQEYGAGSANVPPWYRELGQDYGSHVFVFIGSKLDEPLFHHVMADLRKGRRGLQRGYLIRPNVTQIEMQHFQALNITCIQGTLDDFVTFLRKEIPNPPTGWDLAVAKRPELKTLTTHVPAKQQRALNSVLVVGADTLPRTQKTSFGQIRNFYRGFKPTWQDIIDEVPARLRAHDDFLTRVEKASAPGKLIGLLGPAGSGKSTTLMSVALSLSGRIAAPVYFVREIPDDIRGMITALDEINAGRYFIFVDRPDIVASEIEEVLSKQQMKRGCLVFAERQNIWTRRLKEILGPHTADTFTLDKIHHDDIDPVLSKLKQFGPWTRLEGMSVPDRQKELSAKASRQLLIGLLEATNGLGFLQIIRRDYGDVGSADHQRLLCIVGLATIHRTNIPIKLVGRALEFAGTGGDVRRLVDEMEGVIQSQNEQLSARHPVYIRELFERITNPELIRECLICLLRAFADFEAPVIRSAPKLEGFIFKSIVNNRFVRRMMRDNEDRVLSVYSEFETVFHVDGLYWLQYGLALRGFGRQEEALQMFKTARDAYTSPQIEHAYAQQLLIIAERASSWDVAEPLVNEAVSSLREQKEFTWDTDAYPTVSLAEGHVAVFRKWHTDVQSRELAKQYANELQQLRKRITNDRLEEAATNMLMFATTGVWNRRPLDFEIDA